MKKLLAVLLAALMLLACCSAFAEEIDADLIAAAKEEGELVVYGIGARDLGERLERRRKRREFWAKLTGKTKAA